MGLNECANLVARGDPDRFLATMAAPPKAHALLFPLYAFNLEVARAPWVTAEPLIAEMRLQWWRDVLDEAASDTPPRAHEVAEALVGVIRETGLSPKTLAPVIEARRWDIERQPFADEAAFLHHLDQTGGNLMWAAAIVLEADHTAEEPVRNIARAMALISWFKAVPALTQSGRVALPDMSETAISDLAQRGLGWVAEARAQSADLPKHLYPVLYPAWQTEPLLRLVVKAPERVMSGQVVRPEIARRWGLFWRAFLGKW